MGEGITLQVAALRTKQDAEALVDILKTRGYPVFLVTPEYAHADDNLFRVQVGPFKTRDDADKVRNRLSQEGFKPFIGTEGALAMTQGFGAPQDETRNSKFETRRDFRVWIFEFRVFMFRTFLPWAACCFERAPAGGLLSQNPFARLGVGGLPAPCSRHWRVKSG